MKKVFMVSLLIFTIMFAFHVSGATTINYSKWNLYFENIKVTEGSVNATLEPTITENSNTEITYSVYLNTPGDFYEFTVDIVNGGNIDAMVSEVNGTRLTDKQKKYLDYEVTHIDGTKVEPNDKLRAGTTEKLRIRLEFKKDITADDLPKEDTTLTLSLNTYYIQADNNGVEGENETSSDSDNNSDGDNTKNDTVSNIIKNVQTGDVIITYVVILILAVIALLITKKKSNKEDEK